MRHVTAQHSPAARKVALGLSAVVVRVVVCVVRIAP